MTEVFLRDIVSRSVYIGEMFSDNVCCRETENMADRLLYWKSKTGDVFEKRLTAEGITTEAAIAACGKAEYVGENLPEWTDAFKEVIAMLPVTVEEALSQLGLKKLRTDFPLLLSDSLLVFAIYCKKQLNTHNLEPSFYESLMREFVNRLCEICYVSLHSYQTLLIAGERPVTYGLTAEQRRKLDLSELMLAGELKSYFEAYPVAARVLSEFTERWVRNMQTMIERVKDVGFGEPVHISEKLSDFHNGGQAVYILSFNDGKRRVYKPRSLKSDISWNNFCDTLYKLTGEKLAYTGVTDCGSYGFCDFIEYESAETEESRKAYFSNLGKLLCVMTLLGSTDMHVDNLIEKNEHPYIVDLETIFNHHGRHYNPTYTAMLGISLHTNRNKPDWFNYDGKLSEIDISGITGSHKDSLQLPRVDGDTVDTGLYMDNVKSGFALMYDKLLEIDCEPLKNCFKGNDCRFIPRPTIVYDKLLVLMRSNYMTEGFLYSCEAERLAYSREDELDIFVREKNALLEGDIPLFLQKADTTDLYASDDLVMSNYFLHFLDTKRAFVNMSVNDKEQLLELIKG